MTRIGKLHAWVLANPHSAISFRNFERLLDAFGFSHEPTSGSHRVYVHPRVQFPVSIQLRGKQAKSYQIAQFIAIRREYELTLDD